MSTNFVPIWHFCPINRIIVIGLGQQMEFLREFFRVNQTVILFVYGQVFFVLGLAIVWQSRRHSRLDLARSLGWLGAFLP